MRSALPIAPPLPRIRVPALPTLAPATLVSPPVAPWRREFPIDVLDGKDGSRATLYYLARNGIFHGLRALGVGPGDVVLMPAYHHGVEIQAVRHIGAEPRFYRVDKKLRADLDQVAALVATTPAVRAIYLTHFVGFPQPVDEARALCRERGLLLVEDCALALFSRDAKGRPLGSAGDLSVFCLYKTLPVPHGGLALLSPAVPPRRAPPLFSTAHHLAGLMRARAEQGGGLAHALWDAARKVSRRVVDPVIEHVHVDTPHLEPAELSLGASAIVPWLLRRVDPEQVVVRRRRNFTRLLEQLGDARRVVPGPLPDGVNPLFFPLVVADKRAAYHRLREDGIAAIDFWSGGDPACADALHPEAAWLRRHVIELPIHQDLDDEAIDLVARSVKNVLRNG